jgi:hypothetical protein
VLRAVLAAAGDREPRNDTASAVVEVSPAAAVVFVSTAPDLDARAMLAVLRGALALPARAYLRVAPGQWRVEGSFAPVAEAEVRRAAAAASLLLLHGDTAALGAPRALGRGALGLVAPPGTAAQAGDWFAVGAPPSPLQPALATTQWDSLPPLDVGAPPAGGEWTGLVVRYGRQGITRPAVVGSDAGRRVAVVAAGGFWRWQFRGGRPADAASALWGGLFDWLAAGRGDARRAVPELAAFRAGDPIRWRRTGADSVVSVAITRRGGRRDSLVVRFAAGARTAESPPLPAGVYEVDLPGGRAVVAVNASRELLPRRAALASGPLGTGAARAGVAPRLRDAGWPYAAAALVFCAEWVLRRRRGLR